MSIVNIIFKDHNRKYFQRMQHLSENIESLVYKNQTNFMSRTPKEHYSTVDLTDDVVLGLKEDGWVEDTALFDRLIIEYNLDPLTKVPLQHWRR